MVFRTFFDKDNTLISGSLTNTSRNPIAELYYGGGSGNTAYTRYIFKFNPERLKELYTGGTFTSLGNLTHKIKMVNTGSLDKRLIGTSMLSCEAKERTYSFDLIAFPINQFWDGGIGYDYDKCKYVSGESAYYKGPSNWYSATTLSGWSQPGIISGQTSGATIATQHFDIGNENLEMDITTYVNQILTGATDNGIAIAYRRDYELIDTDQPQYVGFFTRNTNTIYEPYIETVYDRHINDNRNDFYTDKTNKLYLYVNIGGTPTNLDSLPVVKILDNDGSVYSSYTQSAVTHVTKGVYSIDLTVNSSGVDETSVLFNDVWSGLTLNGRTIQPVTLDFEIKPSSQWYSIGNSDSFPKKVGVTTSGIQSSENIIRGDIRKVYVNTKIPYTVNQKQVMDSVEYRIYVKEGVNEFTIIDFDECERTSTDNYFLLFTECLIPSTYYVDIKATSNLEVTTLKEVLSFNIVSESNYIGGQ